MQLDERRVAVSQMTDDEVQAALDEQGVGLTVGEARRVAELIGHDPTLTEMHIFNSEWSEHCSYKSSRTQPACPTSPERHPGSSGGRRHRGVRRHEGKRYGIVMAHESHNHPSQVLPNEGAATGIGGIVRDVDCMGARVIATADPLRFGDPRGGVGRPHKWIVAGVVEGIWQYGNALGVPYLGGDVYFGTTFDDNCLVNVVALGLVAEEDIIHSRRQQATDEPYELILDRQADR